MIKWPEPVGVYDVITDSSTDSESALGVVMAAVAAQAHDATYEAVAAALGVNAEHLRIAVSNWAESQDNLPPPVTLPQLIEQGRKWCESAQRKVK